MAQTLLKGEKACTDRVQELVDRLLLRLNAIINVVEVETLKVGQLISELR